MSSTDVNQKYQKLLQEYAKQRGQITVLKKAVVDEKAKNATLEETLQEKEGTIARNENEIQELKERSKDNTTRSNAVFDQELNTQRQQNANLSQQLQKATERHDYAIKGYEDRIVELQKNLTALKGENENKASIIISLRGQVQEQNSTNSNQVRETEQKFLQLQEKNKGLESVLKDYQERQQEMKSREKGFTDQITALENRLRDNSQNDNQLTTQHRQIVTELEKKVESLERKVITEREFQESLTRQLNEKHLKTIQELQDKIVNLESSTINQNQQPEDYQSVINTLQQRIKQLEMERRNSKQQDISHYQKLISTLKSANNDLEERYRREMNFVEIRAKEAADQYQNTIDSLQQRLTANEQQHTVNNQSEKDDQEIIIKSMQDRITELESALNDKSSSSDGHEQIIRSLQGRIIQLEEIQSQEKTNSEEDRNLSDQEYQRLIQSLQDRIVELESAQASSFTAEQLGTTRRENAALELKVQTLQNNLEEQKMKLDSSQRQLLSIRLERANVADTVGFNDNMFNDKGNKEFIALDVPTHDHSDGLKAKALLGEANTLVGDFFKTLSSWLTYMLQMKSQLQENSSYLNPCEQAFAIMYQKIGDNPQVTLEGVLGLREVSQAFHSFVTYLSRLLPYQKLCSNAVNEHFSNPSSLQRKNKEFLDAFHYFSVAFIKLDNYVQILGNISYRTHDYPLSSQEAVLKHIVTSLNSIQKCAKDMMGRYKSKTVEEQMLTWMSEGLKVTNDCIVSSVDAFISTADKLSRFIGNNLTFFISRLRNSDSKLGVASDTVSSFRRRAVNYMTTLAKPLPESIPYAVAIENYKKVQSSTENTETLSQQVAGKRERITQLEKEKEHWMLEYQLSKVKFEKMQQKLAHLQQENTTLRQNPQNSDSVIENGIHKPSTDTALIQGLAVPTMAMPSQHLIDVTQPSTNLGTVNDVTDFLSDEGNEDIESNRENLIKNYYSARIMELNAKLQAIDSKATSFFSESRVLEKRLELSEKFKQKLNLDLENAQTIISSLKDELQTTTRSYDSQLSMMSEHLCNMNDKLTKKQEEIEALKNLKGGSRRR
ncbi:Protein phosphatase 1 regulatory subunit 21 [Trichoplax sp. H2]|nr:Protein phosphatase 1 regulatory subunit 21 [Trichoplax sp. H2]|eukprot:RDD45972.1 Protein phosphatase 1 regulatory subunit 21 [Trichoplax sp. H2]